MSKRQFKSQASSSRAASNAGFGGFGSASAGSTLSYLAESPDLSTLSDSNVVVAFKNLTKKDATTKSKALEDLRGYIKNHPYESDGGSEEAVLETWVKLYPRLSIENSRRVRELSHTIQYELLKTTRKRMEKYMAKVVGTWLAGTYDRDRAVARSANDGIISFLDTETKVMAFWKRCQLQILEHAQEAFNETPQTLSDERTVSADEMQEKYFRVVGSSISLVINLLIKLNGEDISKCQTKYYDFLSENKRLWSLASCEDAFTRRSVDQLLIVCLAKQPSIVESNLKSFSQSFISEALTISQSNSAFQLLQALSTLTAKFPAVWTSAYKSSKPPLSKIRRFVEKGSQGGPPEYWPLLQSLILSLPETTTSPDLQAALSFLEALRTGLNSREEPKGNIALAWSTYFEICGFFTQKLPDSEAICSLLAEAVFPAFEHNLQSATSTSKWLVSSTQNLAKAYAICAISEDSSIKLKFEDKWVDLGKDLVVRLQTSLPEQSKDFQKSQASVLAQGRRWFELVGQVSRERSANFDALQAPSSNIIEAALKVMSSRNGKPYSAAATIDGAFRHARDFMGTSDLLKTVKEIIEADFSRLIISPSSQYLVSILLQIGSLPGQESFLSKIWRESLIQLLDNPIDVSEIQAVTTLIADERVTTLAEQNENLQEFLVKSSLKAMQGDPRFWELHETAVRFNLLTATSSLKMLEGAIADLDFAQPHLDGSFKILESLAKTPGLLNHPTVRVELVTKLLSLAELSDLTIAPRAIALKAMLESADKGSGNGALRESPIVHVIRENLELANALSLSVDTLVQQAQSVVETTDDGKVLSSLFPDNTKWYQGLQQLLELPPNSALAVMRPFAGAVFLVTESTHKQEVQLSRDPGGYSVPLRMAMYAVFLVSSKAFRSLSRQRQVETLHLLCLISELANDQLDLLEDNKLFQSQQDNDSINEIREFLARTQSVLISIATDSRSWRRNQGDAIIDNHDSSSTVHELIFRLIQGSTDLSPSAYYSAKALSHIISKLIDAHGWQTEGGDEWLAKTDILKNATSNPLGAIGLLTGLAEDLDMSKFANNLCNRLISDVAGAPAQAEKTLPLLVLLNSVLTIYDENDLPVAQNRLVFAVKQILSWNEDLATSNPYLASEACRALQKLLPAIKGVYGSYWEDSLSFCISIWRSCVDRKLSDDKIPMIGMALKLYYVLKNLEDTNDDLEDSLVEYKDKISQSLIKLLQSRRKSENQPLQFVDGLLSRLIIHVSPKSIEDPSELYPFVASNFRVVQSAAYDLLSRALPEVQQEVSVNVLLESTDARLPEELLSLLLDAPMMQNFSDDELAEFPPSIRGYLLSWHLVLTSYPTASYKVRNDYTEILKSENYITPLFNFLFDALGHSAGSPLNLDKVHFAEEEIKAYKIWYASNTESSERNLQWLLINIYYLTLKYTPNLVKSWWLDCKSKQTRNAVESWTQKYFAPLVIQDVLDEVTQWAEEQEDPVDDEKDLIVKIVRKAREIYAGYEVDDMMVQIVIRLPPNYPLEGVKVEGVNRVAASEKKWASWLMITQGAITFSNGSITDGLLTFRKNVIGALKGQTECAICYSIISADKKMPDKRCQTCKNLFHSGCLFKWFASSNQNTCPLCRNPFNYGASSKRGR